MGLSKLAIGLIATTASVGTVGAITAAVVVSKQNSLQSVEANSDLSSPSNTKKEELSKDNIASKQEANLTLEQIKKTISHDSIVIASKQVDESNEELDKNKTYSFNVEPSQLKFKNQALLDKNNVSISFEIKREKNPLFKLNNGELNTTIKLVKKDQKQVEEFDLLIPTFKKASKDLYNLFTSSENEVKTDDSYTLTLTPSTNNKNKFVSIEELNKNPYLSNSGLSEWLKNSSLNIGDGLENVSLIGEVKLEKIAKQENKVEFLLKSKSDEKWIKLTAKKKIVKN